MRRALVTGGLGFIGSHLVDRLLRDGWEAVVLDNLLTGNRSNLEQHRDDPRLRIIEGDIRDLQTVIEASRGCDAVFHLAAHALMRVSLGDHRADLNYNVIGTLNVLEGMSANRIPDLVFASTSALYGEAEVVPTPEEYSGIQTSLYGAAKLAGEAYASAFVQFTPMKFWAFRFGTVLGERCRRGAIWDFEHKLQKDPSELEILGDGRQSKDYLSVSDCVDGIMVGYERSSRPVNIFNLGLQEQTTVDELADIVIQEMGLQNVRKRYTGGPRGWVGDNPVVYLSIKKIHDLGWRPKSSPRDVIRQTARWTLREIGGAKGGLQPRSGRLIGMTKVAVTGGAGFLGSNLVKRLLDDGHDVSVVDNLSSGSLENLRGLGIDQECTVGDLKDHGFARDSLRGAEAVFHLAAEVGSVAYLHGSDARELAALQANLVIDTNVFRACLENGVRSVVYASSVSVYPFDQQLGSHVRFKEEDSETHLNPEGGYGWSKYMGEKQLSLMRETSVGVARIFHAYGQNLYLRPDRSQVIASLMRKAIRYPKEGFVVWGDGSQRRCFVYVVDAVDALARLLDRAEKGESLTVNVGSTEEVTVRELADMVISRSGKRIPLSFDKSKPTGALNRTPDLSRAKRVLGWAPTTTLSEGLSSTYTWAEKRLAEDR